MFTQSDVQPQIRVLSNRADLISGGDALVEIIWPAGTNLAQVTRIELDGVDVKPAFAMRPNGRYMGLLTGLKDGDNLLTVRVGGAGRQITITNHPIGGPVFSGGHSSRRGSAPGALSHLSPSSLRGIRLCPVRRTPEQAAFLRSPSTLSAIHRPTILYYYQPKAKEGTACTFTITGANPCFGLPVINDPASRPADADIADFTNDRGDTVEEPASDREGHDQPEPLPARHLLRSRSAVGSVGAAEGLERQSDVEDGRSHLGQSL